MRDFASRGVRYFWALRVPACSAAVLLWLPTAGFRPAFRPYISGLFDPIGAWALARPLGMGPRGVFVAIAVAFSVLAVVSGLVFRRGRWKTRVV